jgi:hypothetical protein
MSCSSPWPTPGGSSSSNPSTPKYAADPNLIAPWGKTLRSLALNGQRFETWEQICAAGAAATT